MLESYVLVIECCLTNTNLLCSPQLDKSGVTCATFDLWRLRFGVLHLDNWSLGRQRYNTKRVV